MASDQGQSVLPSRMTRQGQERSDEALHADDARERTPSRSRIQEESFSSPQQMSQEERVLAVAQVLQAVGSAASHGLHQHQQQQQRLFDGGGGRRKKSRKSRKSKKSRRYRRSRRMV